MHVVRRVPEIAPKACNGPSHDYLENFIPPIRNQFLHIPARIHATSRNTPVPVNGFKKFPACSQTVRLDFLFLIFEACIIYLPWGGDAYITGCFHFPAYVSDCLHAVCLATIGVASIPFLAIQL